MSVRLAIPSVALLISTTACTSMNLNHALGTPKNPVSSFVDPKVNFQDDSEYWFLRDKFEVLSQASLNPGAYDVPEKQMRAYMAAGYSVSDFYCRRFFDKTDEAYRRRSFGRATTNDVGTVVQTVLGLANAGKSLITGVGAATGLSDSIWRHYDTAFLISADLGNVEGLVDAEKQNLRTRTLAKDAVLPSDWSTAQSAIMQYAKLCSFIGMQRLLNKSTTERTQELNKDTEERQKPTGGPPPGTPQQTPAPTPQLPQGSAEPAVAPNRGE